MAEQKISATPRTDRELIKTLGLPMEKALKGFIEFAKEMEKELAAEKAAASQRLSILLTIQAFDFDKNDLRGHQCLAKQWLCNLQDRLHRLQKTGKGWKKHYE